MHHARLSARVAALFVAALAIFVGASIAQGATFNVDISGVSVSTSVFSGPPASTLTTDPGTTAAPFMLQLNSTTGFPAAGQIVIETLNPKTGAKSNLELLAFNNGTCVEGANQLCITARGQSPGEAAASHAAGSYVKLATQLGTAIGSGALPPAGLITVGSTVGFPSTLSTSANILIDTELFEVHTYAGSTTFHIATRAVATNAGNPTTQAAHLVGAIITSPDTYIITLTRQEHSTGDNTVATSSKPYFFLEPLFPPMFPGVAEPFATPLDLFAPYNLTFTAGGVASLPGTYNTSNGILTITQATCAWLSNDNTGEPTTSVGGASLQWNKDPLNVNQFGALGLVRDTTHSWYSPLSTMIASTGTPAFIEVNDATGAAGSGQVLIGAEVFTYSSKDTSTTPDRLIVSTRGGGGGMAQHNVGVAESPVIQGPSCDELAQGSATDSRVLELGVNAVFDSDGDGCSNWNELDQAGGAEGTGGLRDPFNPYDYMNPTHDGQNRVDDILKVVGQYFKDFPAGDYNPDTDRTALDGGTPWQLGRGNGQQRVDDILAQVKQYFHDC